MKITIAEAIDVLDQSFQRICAELRGAYDVIEMSGAERQHLEDRIEAEIAQIKVDFEAKKRAFRLRGLQ